jgi:plasmid stabilization system protein ParE
VEVLMTRLSWSGGSRRSRLAGRRPAASCRCFLAGHSYRRTALIALATALFASLALGCYNPRSGDPVDDYHYEHVITIFPDGSHIGIRTYINRTHLQVGIRQEDLFDGDRDGKLTTPGMDRVQITDYMKVEDPPEAAERRTGDLRDYDQLYQQIQAAAKAGRSSFRIEDRTYKIRSLSTNAEVPGGENLSSMQ